MSASFSSAAATTQATGASAAFTSDDPIIKKSLSLLDEGKFKEAQSLLASDDGHAQAEVENAREEMKEIIRRTKREYSVSADDLLVKIKKSIPDATLDDVKKWTKAGELQSRDVDGATMYFNREPSNLFRFSKDAIARRDAANPPAPKDPNAWTLHKHLAEVITAAETSGEEYVSPLKHRIKYTLKFTPADAGGKSGSLVRVWLLYPQELPRQREVKLISASPTPYTIAPKDAPQRTNYFEQKVVDPKTELVFEETFEYTSYAYYPKLRDEDAKPLPANYADGCLEERLPHIAFTSELRETVGKIVGDEKNPLAKARKIFHWIDENIAYRSEEEYTIIPSFSIACLSRRKGDCGIHSIMFITMCRAAGIPARWQSGWETKVVGNSMHDWAEFYVAPWGWLPADQSYGLQKSSDDPKIREFYFGHQDSYRTIVSTDYGRELIPPKHSLRSEPADFQRGEVEMDGKNVYFDEWDYDIEISFPK